MAAETKKRQKAQELAFGLGELLEHGTDATGGVADRESGDEGGDETVAAYEIGDEIREERERERRDRAEREDENRDEQECFHGMLLPLPPTTDRLTPDIQ